jgi:hypothetical protein
MAAANHPRNQKIPLVNGIGPKGSRTNCNRLSKIPVGENNHGCQADLPRIGTKNQRFRRRIKGLQADSHDGL